jgi:hypothetical protein
MPDDEAIKLLKSARERLSDRVQADWKAGNLSSGNELSDIGHSIVDALRLLDPAGTEKYLDLRMQSIMDGKNPNAGL